MRLGTVAAGFFALIAAVVVLVWLTSPNRSSSAVESNPSDAAVEEIEDETGERVYPENPFESETASPPPQVEVDETVHNFGRMAVNETSQHTFVVRNVGEGLLKLAKGPSSCTCTMGKLGESEVPPGGSAEITLEWEPPEATPSFGQSATIWTNDPEQPELSLVVEGRAAFPIETYPTGAWIINAVSESEPTPFSGAIVSPLLESFEILSIETSDERVTMDAEPMSEEELAELDALSGYNLSGRIAPGFPVGDIHEQVTIETDVEGYETLEIGIAARRMGPLTIVGPGWYSGPRLLRMGRFEAAEGKTVRLSVFTDAGEEPFTFTDVTVEPPVLDVTWERDEDFGSETRERIYLYVTAPAGMTPGRWSDDAAVSVQLGTNNPRVESVNMSVELQAN